jgi:parallel beta-helix repeat protein
MKKIVSLLKYVVIIAISIFIGKNYFNNTDATVPIPSTMKYRYTGQSGKNSGADVASAFSGTIIEVKNGGSIQKAVDNAQAGDLIRVFPGTYSENIYVDKDDISLQGVVVDGDWPTLDGQKKLNDAFLYSGNGILIENFKIVNYKGNGIMGQAGNNFILRNNWIIDTGVYGIFPQYGKNGLVEHNVLSGIEDAAIYVGMCDNVDVLHNEVFDSVAGIEIENSRHCLVENNYAHNNTAGLLAFITPGLPIKTTFDIIFRNNFVVNNNHKNFGAPGSLVSGIPEGTGILIMAADDVILENNIISGNDNAGIVIVDLVNGADASKDPNSEPNPDRVVILDNLMYDNGNKPKGELKALMMTQFSKKGPDIFAIGGGKGSTILDKNKYRTFGIDHYGRATIRDTKHITTFMMDEPVAPRSVSQGELGELTYYGVCAGCHAYKTRLIGVPTEVIQAIYANNPEGIIDYMNHPKNLRDDYPEMPPQDYLSEEAKIAVAEYILTLKE